MECNVPLATESKLSYATTRGFPITSNPFNMSLLLNDSIKKKKIQTCIKFSVCPDILKLATSYFIQQ